MDGIRNAAFQRYLNFPDIVEPSRICQNKLAIIRDLDTVNGIVGRD
jgi:hypothetical protein